MTGRLVALMALVLIAMAGATQQAFAAAAVPRYASPQGTPADPCTAAHPCDPQTAIDGSGGGDVYLYADRGDYSVSGQPIRSASYVALHGLNGRARLIGDGSSTVLWLTGSVVDGLYVQGSGPYRAAELESTVGDNLIVRSSGNRSACYVYDSSALKNSVCSNSVGDNAAITDGDVEFRNDTLVSTGGPSGVGLYALAENPYAATVTVNLINTVARGAGGAGGGDVVGEAQGTHHLDVVQSNSDYANRVLVGDATVAPASVTAAPSFVDAAHGDFHEVCTSATIDFGSTNLDNGPHDFDGDPRAIGTSTDIGADELTAGPKVTAPSASGVGFTAATLNGAVNPSGCDASWRFEYGTTGLTSQTATQSLPVGSVFKPLSVPIAGLKEGTTYKVQLVAFSARGTTKSPVTTFKTPTDPFTGLTILTKNAKVKKGKVGLRLSCPAGSSGTCAGKVSLTSAKKVLVQAKKKKGKKQILQVGLRSVSIAAGRTATVKIKLTKKARKYFKAHAKLRAQAHASAKDVFGTSRTTLGLVKLKVAKKTKSK